MSRGSCPLPRTELDEGLRWISLTQQSTAAVRGLRLAAASNLKASGGGGARELICNKEVFAGLSGFGGKQSNCVALRTFERSNARKQRG